MTMFITEYVTISFFIASSFCLALILLFAVYLLSFTTKIEGETSSGYECGFQSFSETHFPFTIQYALIAIIFLLFDIEVLYLYPLGLAILSLNTLEVISLIIFFGIVILGLLFEVSRSLLTFYSYDLAAEESGHSQHHILFLSSTLSLMVLFAFLLNFYLASSNYEPLSFAVSFFMMSSFKNVYIKFTLYYLRYESLIIFLTILVLNISGNYINDSFVFCMSSDSSAASNSDSSSNSDSESDSGNVIKYIPGFIQTIASWLLDIDDSSSYNSDTASAASSSSAASSADVDVDISMPPEDLDDLSPLVIFHTFKEALKNCTTSDQTVKACLMFMHEMFPRELFAKTELELQADNSPINVFIVNAIQEIDLVSDHDRFLQFRVAITTYNLSLLHNVPITEKFLIELFYEGIADFTQRENT